MAGSISLSISQQFDNLGNPLAGGLLFFIQAGTTATPQNAFQDSALTLPWPNPLTLDAAGRIPQLYFADGLIKIRLEDESGAVVLTADNILVVGPSSGSGGGGGVDPTTVLQTGWIQPIYGTGVVGGFVRLNGRTIGSSTSGATERANLDAQGLFTFLWNQDANLVVSTGRGVSPSADWAANKQLTLPDWRGRALIALDDMGNTAAGRLTTTFFGTDATVLGAAGGAQSKTLVKANLPPLTPTGTITNGTITASTTGSQVFGGGTIQSGSGFQSSGGTVTVSQAASVFTGSAIGGTSTALAVIPPAMLATFYIKL